MFKSMVTIPLLIFPVLAFVVLGDPGTLSIIVHESTLPSGDTLSLDVGDFIIISVLFLLVLEIIGSTQINFVGMANQPLSMLVLVGCLALFFFWPKYGNVLFFLITCMAAVDVILGPVIGIMVAKPHKQNVLGAGSLLGFHLIWRSVGY